VPGGGGEEEALFFFDQSWGSQHLLGGAMAEEQTLRSRGKGTGKDVGQMKFSRGT